MILLMQGHLYFNLMYNFLTVKKIDLGYQRLIESNIILVNLQLEYTCLITLDLLHINQLYLTK
jgi:hypothetical protein